MNRKIVIATHNPGKLIEYRELLKQTPFEMGTLYALGITDEPEENGKTFEENAILKARFYTDLTGSPTLAEDSGLEIDALNGEPGVLSRRWPGHDATDKELLDILYGKMKDVPAGKRGAQFRVVMAYIAPEMETPLLAEGVVRGIITKTPRASIIPGFPFRSMFYVPELGKTLGEMSIAEEAKIGHRKEAFEKILPHLLHMLSKTPE